MHNSNMFSLSFSLSSPLTEGILKVQAFWDDTKLTTYQHFGEACCLHHQGPSSSSTNTLLGIKCNQNVHNYSPTNEVSDPRRLYSSLTLLWVKSYRWDCFTACGQDSNFLFRKLEQIIMRRTGKPHSTYGFVFFFRAKYLLHLVHITNVT